ncbi:MAG TPA: FAD-binding oxidoreductase, partial [Mycobacterium sp.]
MTIAPTRDIADLTDRVTELRSLVEGAVALASDPGYARCAPWNVAVAVEPAAVVFARSARDVAETVRFAASVGCTVAVAATGHGALPVGPDSILLHTGEMTGCDVDPDARVARVGAGATWQHVLDAATPYGLAPLCGSSPSVGVVGFLTGGGIGPLVRTVGVSWDYVRAFELVTGSGDILRVTPEQHGDLFWGLRGSKSTLGIVTAVEIDLPLIPEFYGGTIYFDGSHAASVLHAW